MSNKTYKRKPLVNSRDVGKRKKTDTCEVMNGRGIDSTYTEQSLNRLYVSNSDECSAEAISTTALQISLKQPRVMFTHVH